MRRPRFLARNGLNALRAVAGRHGAGIWVLALIAALFGFLPPNLLFAQAVTQFPFPTDGGTPEFMAVGPDSALWFTEIIFNKMGRITTAGVITQFTVTTLSGQPYGIATGRDG